MIQFYSPDVRHTGLLTPEDSLHCTRVLRHKAGDHISVVDGTGVRFDCVIEHADPRSTLVSIAGEEPVPPHWGTRITLAVAPTKNMDRMEWMVEKAVEIGVDRIVPVLCDHSERKVIKTDRLRKIAVSAMKQSLKAVMPEIDELTPLRQFLKDPGPGPGFMGYCDKEYPLLRLVDEYQPAGNVKLLIGPEGDFSPEEVALAVGARFIPVTFGLSRLRTETAAISALDTIHIINQLRGK